MNAVEYDRMSKLVDDGYFQSLTVDDDPSEMPVPSRERHVKRVAAGIAGALMLLSLGACGASAAQHQGQANITSASTSAPIVPIVPAAKTISSAVVITDGAGGSVAITLVGTDPHPSIVDGWKPDAGNRWYADQLKFVNSGASAYSDIDVPFSTEIKDTLGQSFPAIKGYRIAGKAHLGSANIQPGDVALGWILFQLPTASKPSQIQYTPNGEYGGVAEWNV